MARSLNKVTLIGNLTRDPELRYTPSGTAVTTFTIATNRQWKTEGELKEDAEFHRIVAWDKLAEICSQFLKKGRQAYVEGRLQTRKWQTKEGEDKYTTEVVISEMILLDRGGGAQSADSASPDIPDDFDTAEQQKPKAAKHEKKATKSKIEDKDESQDDIPF